MIAMSLQTLLFAVLLVISCHVAFAQSLWTSYAADNQNSCSISNVDASISSGTFNDTNEQWAVHGGDVMGMTISSDLSLIFATAVADGAASTRVLFALNIADGSQLWHADVNVSVTPSPPASGYSGAHSAVFAIFAGELWCYSQSGQLTWQHHVTSHHGFGRPPAPLLSSDGTVYVMVDDAQSTLSAYSALDGHKLWASPVMITDATIIGGALSVDQRTMYVTDGDASLYAVDLQVRRIVWQKTPASAILATVPIYYPNIPLIIMGTTLHSEGAVYAYSSSGNQTWSLSSDAFHHRQLLAFDNITGVIYVPNAGGELQQVRADTGDVVWQVDVDLGDTAPLQFITAIVPDYVLVLSGASVLLLHSSDGSVVWEFDYEVDQWNTAALVVPNGNFYTSFMSDIAAFGLYTPPNVGQVALIVGMSFAGLAAVLFIFGLYRFWRNKHDEEQDRLIQS